MSDHGLGRIAAPDPRDHNYLLSPPKPAPKRRKRTWPMGDGRIFSQGDNPWCVSYAANRLLVAGPVRNKMPMGFEAFYRECQKRDGIPGAHDGSTVRAAMALLKELGMIPEYRWAFDLPTCRDYILTTGPMDVGTDWFDDMFAPDADGWIGLSDVPNVAGGHSWMVDGIDLDVRCPDGTVGAIEMTQSWGLRWGKPAGRARMSFKRARMLLNRSGEAAVATEIKCPQ